MKSRHRRLRGRIFRDPQNGYLGGVCEGLASGFRLPAIAVRIVAVILLLMFGTVAVLGYGAAWLLMDTREELLIEP